MANARQPAPSPAGPSVGRQIGATARRLRNSLGLTLGEIAKRSNISAAMLSRLENGDVSPSLETLAALTAALGVPLSNLFSDVGKPRGGAQHVPKGQGLEVVRRGTKRGHTYHLLAADRGPRRAFEPFLVTLNDKSEVFPGFEHPGTEFIYLLEGSLTYRHGDETHLLKAGDSLTFAGEVPHGPEKLIKTPIRMLSIIIYAETARD
jgi:DNA-binding XRE family transcriptional regulator/mannose-6-phosphate isomerase-like protein (cupin superfamily)